MIEALAKPRTVNQLVKTTKLSQRTVYRLLDELPELGYVIEYWQEAPEGRGRPASLFQLVRGPKPKKSKKAPSKPAPKQQAGFDHQALVAVSRIGGPQQVMA
jgi:predicted ArsR family transcriptional regulator